MIIKFTERVPTEPGFYLAQLKPYWDPKECYSIEVDYNVDGQLCAVMWAGKLTDFLWSDRIELVNASGGAT